MKKLLVIAVLGLLWNNLALAECIQGDCKNGKGTWQYKKLPMKYIGEFRNGLAHGKAIVEWCGKMKQKYSLALIGLYLIKNNKLLKSSTSKHARNMIFGNETGQNSSVWHIDRTSCSCSNEV